MTVRLKRSLFVVFCLAGLLLALSSMGSVASAQVSEEWATDLGIIDACRSTPSYYGTVACIPQEDTAYANLSPEHTAVEIYCYDCDPKPNERKDGGKGWRFSWWDQDGVFRTIDVFSEDEWISISVFIPGPATIKVESFGDSHGFNIKVRVANNTPTPTPTQTSTSTSTASPTPTVTTTASPTPSLTPTGSVTPSVTPTSTPTKEVTPTPSPTGTPVTPTSTPDWTPTPTKTPSFCVGQTLGVDIYNDDNRDRWISPTDSFLHSLPEGHLKVTYNGTFVEQARADNLPEWTNITIGTKVSSVGWVPPAGVEDVYEVVGTFHYHETSGEWESFVEKSFSECQHERYGILLTSKDVPDIPPGYVPNGGRFEPEGVDIDMQRGLEGVIRICDYMLRVVDATTNPGMQNTLWEVKRIGPKVMEVHVDGADGSPGPGAILAECDDATYMGINYVKADQTVVDRVLRSAYPYQFNYSWLNDANEYLNTYDFLFVTCAPPWLPGYGYARNAIYYFKEVEKK